MRILIVGIGSKLHLEIAWARAFRTLGNDAEIFAFDDHLNYCNRYLIQRTLFFSEGINQKLVAFAENYKPDLVFLFRALLVKPKTVDKLKSMGFKVVFQNIDNCFMQNRRKFWSFHVNSILKYDHIFAYRESCRKEYIKCGVKSCSVLKPYYVPWIHFNEKPLSFDERKFDICFIGHCEKDFRIEAVNRLIAETKFKILIAGKNWQYLNGKYKFDKFSDSGIPNLGYTDALANSKVALTFFSYANKDLYTRRVYEIPAAGTLLASPITIPMLSIYSASECLYFSNQWDIIENISPVINSRELWQRYFSNVREVNSQESYNIIGRAKEFIKQIENL